jgi:hypothetical protein
METHQSYYFTLETFKVVWDGVAKKALKLGPTINGSLSNNLFDRKLVTHLPVLQSETLSDQKNKLIVCFTVYLGLIRHTDRQRRRRGTCHPIIINSGTMIRLMMSHLGLIHYLHTIIDNFSSAFPVSFDRSKTSSLRVIIGFCPRAPTSSFHRYAHACSCTLPFPLAPNRSRSRNWAVVRFILVVTASSNLRYSLRSSNRL